MVFPGAHRQVIPMHLLLVRNLIMCIIAKQLDIHMHALKSYVAFSRYIICDIDLYV